MNIYEQILAGLQTKFPGADAATLQRIASKKSEGVTDADKVNSIVEGIGFADVMNNYGDFRANGASVTAKKNAIADYEKQYGLKDGKPMEAEPKKGESEDVAKKEPTNQEDKPKENEVDIKALVDTAVAAAVGKVVDETLAKAGISASIKTITERLDTMDANAAKAAHEALVDAKAKEFGIPTYVYKGKVIDGDADLNKYFADLKQEMVNDGFKFPTPPDTSQAETKDEADEIAALIAKGTEERVKQMNNN